MPLTVLFLCYKLSFLKGLLWGTVFFIIHMAGFFYASYHQANGVWSLLAPLLLVVYCSFYCGLWFWLAQKISRYRYGLVGWLFLSCLYFWWVHCGVLWFTGVWQGYPLSFPLLPLLWLPQIALPINFFGKWATLILSLSFQILFVNGVMYHKKWFFGAFLCLVPFLSGFFIKERATVPAWVETLCYIPLQQTQPHWHDTLQELCITVEKRLRSCAGRRCIVLPESALPFSVATNKLALQMLQENILANNNLLFCGGHKKEGGKLYNCFYSIDKRRIILCYEKSHLIPFFEYNPFSKGLFSFFLHKKEGFISSEKTKKVASVNPIGDFIPVLCSELFYQERSYLPAHIPLLCLMNDAHFGPTLYGKTMLLYAQMVALQEQRSLAYFSSFSAYFISPKGALIRELR